MEMIFIKTDNWQCINKPIDNVLTLLACFNLPNRLHLLLRDPSCKQQKVPHISYKQVDKCFFFCYLVFYLFFFTFSSLFFLSFFPFISKISYFPSNFRIFNYIMQDRKLNHILHTFCVVYKTYFVRLRYWPHHSSLEHQNRYLHFTALKTHLKQQYNFCTVCYTCKTGKHTKSNIDLQLGSLTDWSTLFR